MSWLRTAMTRNGWRKPKKQLKGRQGCGSESARSSRFPRYPVLPYGEYAYPQHLQQTGVGARAGARRARPSSGPPVQRAVGLCFACGDMGHLKTYSPKMQPLEKKWYPSTQRHESVQDVCTVQTECFVGVKCGDSVVSNSVDEEVIASGCPLLV